MEKVIAVILAGLMERMPLNIMAVAQPMPEGKKVGLVIVDEVNGFCTPGAGNLAPPAGCPDPMIDKMVENTNTLARYFDTCDEPILVLQEAHTADRPEPPYPVHCVRGSGEELLVPELRWLYDSKNVTVVEKSCINGVIGAMGGFEFNLVFEWVDVNKLDAIIVVGICTDICVLQFVQTMLSVRNLGEEEFIPSLKDVIVYTEGCSTYNLPIEVAKQIGLPEFLSHDQQIAHYMGLYLMQTSGAILVEKFEQ